MRMYNCQYAKSSDVFKGLPKAFDALASRDNLPFSWGDNNHSLVDADTVATELEQLENSEGGQIAKAIRRLRRMGQTYIDFEN